MTLLDKLSIKNKLVFAILFVTMVTAFIGFSIVIFTHIRSLKRDLIQNLEMEAKLIGEYCITPLTFDRKEEADSVLNKLRSLPLIVKGELYDKDDNLFAVYKNAKTSENINIKNTVLFKTKGSYGFNFVSDKVYFYKTIDYKNEKYGTVYLCASAMEYAKNIKTYLITMALLMLLLFILSYALANMLQKIISGPILALASFTKKVSATRDYTLSIERKSNDEIAVLYDGFNKMLEQINRRENERDLAETSLRASENKNRTLLEAIPDMIFIFDKSGTYKYFKAKNELLLSMPGDRLIGKTLKETGFSDQQVKKINIHFDKAFRTKQVQTFNYELKVQKGECYFEARILALNEDEVLGIIRDMTEQRETEKQLGIERVKADAATEADKLKSAFLANMSHEIRTPMNAIIGFSNLLREENISDQEKNEYIDIINKSGDNLMHLIDDIIDISKIEAGQLVIRKSECQVNHILSDLYVIFDKDKKSHGRENLILGLKIPDKENDITIITDVYRFRQILTNLLSNALKFTENGMVEYGYDVLPDKQYLQFYVKDTGIGIPKDSLEEIFERFKKIEDKRTKLYGGAGLGLAICRNLIETLGGKIWVESVKGKGTTIYFTLPYKLITNTEEIMENIPEPDSTFRWNDKTILVVEDEDFVCKFFERILGPTKANLVWARDGMEAVDICKSDFKIDVILMDMKLPELSGYEAVKRIKAYNNKLPIIAQTAYAMSEDRFTCLEVGCDDYISKPINPSLLMEKLALVLNK